MVVDALDRDILIALAENARLSYRQLAKRLQCSTPTIATRVRRLEQLGIIKGYTLQLTQEPTHIPASFRVACHTCNQETSEPHWLRLDDKLHPFCCAVCRASYRTKYDSLRRGM